MPRDPRNYITVHNGLPEHPKVEPLSDAAFRLLIESWCYCDRNNTDGEIRAAVWSKRATKKVRAELVDALLVEEKTDGGVQMHDYDQHQRTAAEKVETSSKRAAAGRAGGLAKASNALANASQVAKQTPSKNVAELELEKEEQKDLSSELRPDVESVCKHLADRVEQNGSKRPTITQQWRTSARLLIDKDGRTEQQIHAAIDWCQEDNFWRSNILSMSKLREKYDQLRLKAGESKRNLQSVPPPARSPWTPEPPPIEIEDDPQACDRWFREQHRLHEQASA